MPSQCPYQGSTHRLPRSSAGQEELGNGLGEPSTNSPGGDIGNGGAIGPAEYGGLSLSETSAQSIARVDGRRSIIEDIRDGNGLICAHGSLRRMVAASRNADEKQSRPQWAKYVSADAPRCHSHQNARKSQRSRRLTIRHPGSSCHGQERRPKVLSPGRRRNPTGQHRHILSGCREEP